MLEHTQKIEELYEDIQKRLFYMIPEKWDKLYLYASVMESLGKVETGELFFYYIPKGLLKKNPVNVYEIPSKFNLDEKEYLKLVELLYKKIKELRKEFKKIKQNDKLWSNLTISIKNMKFKEEKEILKQYLETPEIQTRKEKYECGIYIQSIQNIIDYETQDYDVEKNMEDFDDINQEFTKNQILLFNEKK